MSQAGATAEGATAGILLYTGGTEVLAGLKAGVVSFGLPFTALVLVMCYGLYKALREEDVVTQSDLIELARSQRPSEEEGAQEEPAED